MCAAYVKKKGIRKLCFSSRRKQKWKTATFIGSKDAYIFSQCSLCWDSKYKTGLNYLESMFFLQYLLLVLSVWVVDFVSVKQPFLKKKSAQSLALLAACKNWYLTWILLMGNVWNDWLNATVTSLPPWLAFSSSISKTLKKEAISKGTSTLLTNLQCF